MDDSDYDRAVRLAEYMAEADRMIEEHGFMVQGVRDETFFWLYTIGLSNVEHPELALTIGDPRVGHQILNHVGRGVLDRTVKVTPGQAVQDDRDGRLELRCIEIDPARTVAEDWFNMLHSRRGVREPLRVWQIVWPGVDAKDPDQELHFPSDVRPWRDQPLWGTPYWS